MTEHWCQSISRKAKQTSITRMPHWYERPIKKRKILCKYPISGVSQEGPLRILVKILKSRAGQFLRLLHKKILGAFFGKFSLIKKLRIGKKWSHAKFQLLKPHTDGFRAKKTAQKSPKLAD